LFRRPKLTPSCSAERKEGRKLANASYEFKLNQNLIPRARTEQEMLLL
jgi:hypothetical protein